MGRGLSVPRCTLTSSPLEEARLGLQSCLWPPSCPAVSRPTSPPWRSRPHCESRGPRPRPCPVPRLLLRQAQDPLHRASHEIPGFPQNSCVTAHLPPPALVYVPPLLAVPPTPQGHRGAPRSDPSPHPNLEQVWWGCRSWSQSPPGPAASEPVKLLPGLSHPGLGGGSTPALRKASQRRPLPTGPMAWPRPQGQSAWLSIRACSGPAGRGHSVRTCELMSEGRTGGQSAGRRWVTFGLRRPPQEARKGLQGLLKQPGPQPHQAQGKGPLPRGYKTLPGLLGTQSHVSGARAGAEPQRALQMGFAPWALQTDQLARWPLCTSGHQALGPRCRRLPRHLGSTPLTRATGSQAGAGSHLASGCPGQGEPPGCQGNLGAGHFWAGGAGAGTGWGRGRDRASISGIRGGGGDRNGEAGGSVSECPSNCACAGAGERPLGGGLGRTQAPPRHHWSTPRPAHAPPQLSETGRIKQAKHSHVTYKTVNTSL